MNNYLNTIYHTLTLYIIINTDLISKLKASVKEYYYNSFYILKKIIGVYKQ